MNAVAAFTKDLLEGSPGVGGDLLKDILLLIFDRVAKLDNFVDGARMFIIKPLHDPFKCLEQAKEGNRFQFHVDQGFGGNLLKFPADITPVILPGPPLLQNAHLFQYAFVALVFQQALHQFFPRVDLVAFLVDGFSGQQQLRLDPAKGSSYENKLTGQIDIHRFHLADIRQKVVGDLGDGNVVDIQLVALDKKQQQVKRTFKLRYFYGIRSIHRRRKGTQPKAIIDGIIAVNNGKGSYKFFLPFRFTDGSLMNLRKIYYRLSPKLRFLARKLYYLPIDLYESLANKRDKYEPPKGDIYIGSGDFIEQGRHQVDLLKKHLQLKPADHVLDIGSGIGRTAIPLTKYLSEDGAYEGFDVVEKGVKWCSEKISKDYPNFNFRYVPLNNDLYHHSDNKASEFAFPYKSEQFDIAFLFSVFTHMQVREIDHYLAEISRVLKPGGKCLATFFLYDDESEAKIAALDHFNFPVKRNGYRLMDEKVKSANIAIHRHQLQAWLKGKNFGPIKIIDGYWKNKHAKRQDNSFQDLVILEKPPNDK